MGLKKYVLCGLIALLAASNIYFMLGKDPGGTATVGESKNYSLLARRIFIENPNDILINFTPVRKIIDDKFAAMTAPHSVYFEYLPTGTTVKDAAETQLIAASLVKLPLVMNLYHASELKKISLDKKIQLTEDDLDPTYGDLYLKGVGYTLTLREAAKIALTQSDNTAARAINRSTAGLLKQNEEALYWLDVDYDVRGNEAIFNSRSYTSILACLYFSCYLDPQSSQDILTFLSQSIFDDRLTKDIPDNIKVAHKFGTYDNSSTYSDCGIFYVPKRPYILCIMMQGDEKLINDTMSDVSKRIYDTVLKL